MEVDSKAIVIMYHSFCYHFLKDSVYIQIIKITPITLPYTKKIVHKIGHRYHQTSLCSKEKRKQIK